MQLNKVVWSLAMDVDLAREGVFGGEKKEIAPDVDLAPEGVFGGKKRKLLHRVRQSVYLPVANCGLYAINQAL